MFDIVLTFLVSPISAQELGRVLLALPAALVSVIDLPQVWCAAEGQSHSGV